MLLVIKARLPTTLSKARLVEAEVRKQFLLQQHSLEEYAMKIRRQREDEEEEMRRQLQLLQVEQEITVAKELTRLQGSSSSTSSVKSRFPHTDINPSQNQPAKASRQPRDPRAFVSYNKTNTEQAASNNHDSIRD